MLYKGCRLIVDIILKLKRRIKGGSYYKEEMHISDECAPVFYIIRRVPYGEGFFSNYFYVLSHVVYALNKGWNPVVDMKNYKTLYHDKDDSGNLWEKYFEPMNGITLEEAYNSKNYVLSSGKYLSESGVPVYEVNQGHITDDMVKVLKPIVDKYIHVKKNIMDEIDKFKAENKWYSSEIIGVHVRGTDMKLSREAHTLPPKIPRIEEKIDIIIANNNKIRIFLCTDEDAVINYFVNKYNEKIIYTQEYRSTSDTLIGLHKERLDGIREKHKYLLGKEILIDSLLLSDCSYLICGISNVTSGAVLFNENKYIEVEVL